MQRKKRSITNNNVIIEELKDQNFQFYQHNQGTCACVKCVCGKCKCNIKHKPCEFPKNIRSIYQQHFPWRKPGSKQKNWPKNYKSNLEQIHKESTYAEHFKPFLVNSNETPQKEILKKIEQPFQSTTQYQRDYIHINLSPTKQMRPLNQFFTPKVSQSLAHSTYRSDFKHQNNNSMDFVNFAKENSMKLHTGYLPNLFLQTTYNSTFRGEQGEKNPKFSQDKSFLPMGLNGDPNQQFKTNNRINYTLIELKKCPARVVLEEISQSQVLPFFNTEDINQSGIIQ